MITSTKKTVLYGSDGEINRLFSLVTFTFSWRDRLRVLFGRQVCVRVETTTDVEVKQAESHSEVTVSPIWSARAATEADGA